MQLQLIAELNSDEDLKESLKEVYLCNFNN